MRAVSATLIIFISIALIHAGMEVARADGASYKVNGDLTSLGEIAIYLYGTQKMAPEIASWNQFQISDRLHVGQVLRLEKQPTLSSSEGHELLLKMWRRRLEGKAASAKRTIMPAASESEPETPRATPIGESEPETPRAIPIADSEPEATSEVPPAQFKALEEEVQKVEEIQAEKEVLPVEFFAPPTPEKNFSEGEKFLAAEDYNKALSSFRAARKAQPKMLAAWFYELRTLKKLNRADEARKVAEELVDENPQVSSLPAVQSYLRSDHR